MRRRMTVAAGTAALVVTAGAYADADLTNWSAQESQMRIEQQAPHPASVNAPVSHWRPFFLQDEGTLDPAFTTREREDLRATDRRARTAQKAAKPEKQRN